MAEMTGIFAIYKTVGPTSHDIINQLRQITGITKIGHAGTLDPLASGVLVVGIGRKATRELGNILKHDKEYLAKIKFGYFSATDDAEGAKNEVIIKNIPTFQEVQATIKFFIGKILQTPPAFSAIKLKGQAAYKLARRGIKPELSPRLVEVKNMEIINYNWPDLELKINCGSGVYIRAIARDLGTKLGVGGYLAGLERTRVGDFTKKDALTLEHFKIIATN